MAGTIRKTAVLSLLLLLLRAEGWKPWLPGRSRMLPLRAFSGGDMEFEIKYQDLRRRGLPELRILADDLGIPSASIDSAGLDELAKMVAYNLRSDELAAA